MHAPLENEPFEDWDFVRDGASISVRRSGREVTIRVRERPADQVSDDPQPAFPGPPRIALWGEGNGMIHGRVQPPTIWRRLVASITGQPIQTSLMQIEALVEELLSEMVPEPQRDPEPPTSLIGPRGKVGASPALPVVRESVADRAENS